MAKLVPAVKLDRNAMARAPVTFEARIPDSAPDKVFLTISNKNMHATYELTGEDWLTLLLAVPEEIKTKVIDPKRCPVCAAKSRYISVQSLPGELKDAFYCSSCRSFFEGDGKILVIPGEIEVMISKKRRPSS